MVPARTQRLTIATTPTLSSVQLSAFLSAISPSQRFSIPRFTTADQEHGAAQRRRAVGGSRGGRERPSWILRECPPYLLRQELADIRVGRGLQLVGRALEEHLALAQHHELRSLEAA